MAKTDISTASDYHRLKIPYSPTCELIYHHQPFILLGSWGGIIELIKTLKKYIKSERFIFRSEFWTLKGWNISVSSLYDKINKKKANTTLWVTFSKSVDFELN